MGDVRTATRRADELFAALKDSDGQWWAMSVQSKDGAMTRVYMGRDNTKEQLQLEVSGKRVVSLLARKRPKGEVYMTKRDGVVHVDRLQVVKLLPGAYGAPQVRWNMAAMDDVGVTKQQVQDAIDRGDGAGGAQPN